MENSRSLSIAVGGIAALFLMTGCVPRVPAPELPQKEKTTERSMWRDTANLEDHYSLKPEPYSLESNEHDPELLGPQSTIKRSLVSNEMVESPSAPTAAGSTEEKFLPREEPKAQKPAEVMSRSKCIDLIGKAKYDEYTKRYGSEAAALRKCTILQRVQH
jgi:hypothetical protein